MPDWKNEVVKLDIADVALQLGVQLAPGRRSPRLAVCPFHDDSSPSLNLYQDDDPHYHCFACHAHGDTVELVKQKRGVDFREALKWLDETFRLGLGDAARRRPGGPDIRQRALAHLREQDKDRQLAAFGKSRGFTLDTLTSAGLAAGTLETFLQGLARDGPGRDEAVEAGLAYAADADLPAALRSTSLSPFVQGPAVFIPLSNLRGKVTGIMARPFAGAGPKYRFTAKFRKSEILYRSDHVRRLIEVGQKAALDGAEDRFDLFLVEGVFDALRLESLGFPAVAILGAALSDAQADQIGELAEFALEKGRVLRLHLFFDADDSGRRGMSDGVPRLLRRAAERDFLIDVVAVDRSDDEKADPDVLLSSKTRETAAAYLRDRLASSLDALAAVSLGLSFAKASDAVAQLDAAGSIALQNRLSRRLQKLDWPNIWFKVEPHRTTIGKVQGPETLVRVYARLAHDLRRQDGTDVSRALPTPFEAGDRSADANLLHALVLARESADTREYPVDVAAWDRIDEGAPAFLPVLETRLLEAKGPGRPYLAHYEAKDSGAPRLKCGPCPEDAIQQQYVLSELLRVRAENRDVAEQVPAVRYWADQPGLVVTGETRPRSPVSFAYQIDMRALEERPDRSRRRDMFRPFLDCWNSFIRHIGGRIDRMQSDLIYIARLDIKSFYDNVPRHAVARVLDRALPPDETLKTLDIAGQLGGPDDNRRATLIRWLLDHSFGADGRGYAYVDPATGAEARRHGGGAKGLPQGPVLSSYLANIVLFELDAALEARVRELDAEAAQDQGPRTCGAVYARYVDDIVIAARSPDALRSLRSAIEAKLEPLGLELNEKSQHLAPMTPEDARNWVVERRGAGFIAYGDVEDQPAPAADIRTGWEDIPSLDRRTALSVLNWSALDDPEQTPRETFEALIFKVAEAEALRAPDLGHVARRVLLRSALDALAPGGVDLDGPTCSSFLEHLKALFKPLRPAAVLSTLRLRPDERPVAEALAYAREYAAVLAGLERLVTGAPEHNPTFSETARRQIGLAKQALLRWILDDRLLSVLFETLVPNDRRGQVRQQLGAQLDIQVASLEERAAKALRLQSASSHEKIRPRDSQQAPRWPAAAMVRIGWLRTFCPDGLEGEQVEASKDLDLVLHLIAAGAQVEGERLAAPLTVLTAPSLYSAIASLADRRLSALGTLPRDAAARIAATFRALAGVQGSDPVAFDYALPALLAWASGPGRAGALARRYYLLEQALPGVTLLPVAPLPNQPGLFGYEAGKNRVHALFTRPVDAPLGELPRDLDWREDGMVSGLPHYVADLPADTAFLLDPVRQTRRIDDDLATIADVFEGLVDRHGFQRGATTPLISVFSLVGPARPTGGAPPVGYFSLSWTVPREQADRLIFERRGDGLALQRSPHAGAELWRIGQAVSDLFSIPVETEDEEDAAGLKSDRQLLQARLKRTAIGRLRGRWIQEAQVTAALATGTLPHSLERILKALREASGDAEAVGPLALEFLLSGRAMRVRMRLGDGVDVPGGWARFLETVGAQGLRSGDDHGVFASPDTLNGLARPARALARAGAAVNDWAGRAQDARCRQVLEATALGFELAALRSDLRDFSLALLARMTPQMLGRLRRVRPDLSAFGGLGPALLVEPRFGYGQGGARLDRAGERDGEAWGFEADWQARELFVALGEALGDRALKGRATLDRISTVGWLCVLCVMAGALDFEMETLATEVEAPPRPTFFPFQDPSTATALKALADRLLSLPPGYEIKDAHLWPWETTATLPIADLRLAIGEARTALVRVRGAAGVGALQDAPALRSLVPGDQTAVFHTGDGDHYELPWWRCSLTATSNERIDRTETVSIGDRRFHPCSMLTDGKGILVVQVVSEALAGITGLSQTDAASPDCGGSPDDVEVSGAGAVPVATHPPEPPDPVEQSEARSDTPPGEDSALPASPERRQAVIRPPHVARPPSDPPRPESSGRSAAAPCPFVVWRDHQDRSWRRRGRGAGVAESGYGRVAILQYDFVDSYNTERLPSYRLDGQAVERDLRVDAGAAEFRLSYEEHRRRQVLASVLSCCDTLGVEALLLPEYSAHPETVTWIEQHCRERAYNVSVWAGTFRQQPGFALARVDGRYQPAPETSPSADVRPMETHLSVVYRGTEPQSSADTTPFSAKPLVEGVHHRRKKYPSIGMGEEFKPTTERLAPLMAPSRSLERLESFITELVCSELFVFNGPLNWRHFAEHLATSSARYRVDLDVNKWMDSIVEDAKSVALTFSGAPGHTPRRTLLFVTCATTRDADYHYFAQSAYLASGLVTAFCNSSARDVTGGSCFIGQGGWETRGSTPSPPNPYHGAAPGLLSNGEHRGALGPRENALIVADVRPDRTVEDKPRSQARGAPMRLVAHIPIIERQSSSPFADTWARSAFRLRRATWIDPADGRGRLSRADRHAEILHEAASEGMVDLDSFVEKMASVVSETESAGLTLELDVKGRDRLLAAALSLAGLFKNSPGMTLRAKALAEHHASHPERLPCPALLDWLIVDLDLDGFEGQLRGLVAASEKCGSTLVSLTALPPELRNAPWRWCARLEKAEE